LDFVVDSSNIDFLMFACRSFGVVLWELLIHEIPYKDVDSSAIIWGVGSNSLQLPIPETCPEGLKLLMSQCWSVYNISSCHCSRCLDCLFVKASDIMVN